MTEERWQQVGAGNPYRAEAHEARRLGYATSHDEVIAGLSSIAAPIRFRAADRQRSPSSIYAWTRTPTPWARRWPPVLRGSKASWLETFSLNHSFQVK